MLKFSHLLKQNAENLGVFVHFEGYYFVQIPQHLKNDFVGDTPAFALMQGLIPVVPPKKRKTPWQYDSEFYKRRNEVERFFPSYQAFSQSFYSL